MIPEREVLKPLVARMLELAERPDEERKKALWARLNALEPAGKIPVSMHFENVPDRQWDAMFGRDHLRCQGELARRIEFDLKKRIWAAEHLCYDHVTWPAVAIPARYTPQHHAWGVALHSTDTGDELGSTAVIAPFAGRIDMARVRWPRGEAGHDGGAGGRSGTEPDDPQHHGHPSLRR